MKPHAIVMAAGLLAACHTPAFPEGTGRGVTSYDRDRPEGVLEYQRPTWKEGDRFVYRRGGVMRIPQRVVKADENGYVLEHEVNGVRTVLDRDLGLAGGEVPGDPLQERREEPPEPVLHWPLWVGKRWTSEFVRKMVDQPALPLQASYYCDAVETVQVPAGTFACLRIWRRARVLSNEQYLERTTIMWYSPDVGYFAQRLEAGELLELEEYHRQ
jgi:hypothetical protein